MEQGHATEVVPYEKKLQEWVGSANKALREIESNGGQIIGAVSFQAIPDQFRPVVTAVKINSDIAAKEMYPQKGGNLSLSAKAFQKISDALGIQWDANRSHRLDDGSDPDYCLYRAVGWIMGDHGGWRMIMGEKEIRVSVLAEEIEDNYLAKTQRWISGNLQRNEYIPADFKPIKDSPEKVAEWIREKIRMDTLQLRKHLLARTQSGAMARATKSIGIRETYSQDEAAKLLFGFKRLVFAPNMNNPQVQAHFLRQSAGPMNDLYPSREDEHHSGTAIPKPTSMDASFYVMEEDAESSQSAGTFHEKPATTSAPSPHNHARADFECAEPPQQVIILKGLMTQKAYSESFKKPLEKFDARERLAFYDKLMSLPDHQPQQSTSQDLPFT